MTARLGGGKYHVPFGVHHPGERSVARHPAVPVDSSKDEREVLPADIAHPQRFPPVRQLRPVQLRALVDGAWALRERFGDVVVSTIVRGGPMGA
ncbi:hypothetical protein [Arthrobacter silvisoli]|uniref:hypothetical protein n=1 Tax=Arthrobacter silvisoli TaxID=2291022 RepID=UPI00109BD9B3|nr:hypothetical protein [Arthrobacter silvisoli]